MDSGIIFILIVLFLILYLFYKPAPPKKIEVMPLPDVFSTKIKQPIKNIETKWLSFLQYVFLPFSIIICLALKPTHWTSIVVYVVYPILMISLFRKKEITIDVYKVFSIISPVLFVGWRVDAMFELQNISYEEYVKRFVIGYVTYLVVWTWPNLIYIKKRKHLFSDNKIADISIQNDDQPINKKRKKNIKPKKIKSEQVKIDNPIEAINRLAKLKNEGTLTEEEFQTKKKELLDRI